MRTALVIAVVATTLAMPSAAGAAVTIGGDLGPSDGRISCVLGHDPNIPCTAVQTALPGRAITAPFDGVIVRWRIADAQGSFRLRVVRDAGGGAYTGAGRTDTAFTAPIATFQARLPIRAGDRIGIDRDPYTTIGFRRTVGAIRVEFFPALRDGETRQPTFTDDNGREMLFNADIEPDADRDGYGDETQDSCRGDSSSHDLCAGPCANDRVGTEADDALVGTQAGDGLRGLGGDDGLVGLSGDDCLSGGEGSDRVDAGPGRDLVAGEEGADQLDGGDGNDELAGGDGDDALGGGTGNDRLAGGFGDDRLADEAGSDRLGGGAGNDRLTGGEGSPYLVGGDGDDRLVAGSAAGRLSGGAGRDVIRAANGHRDVIACGRGRDTVVADRRDRVGRRCERVRRRASLVGPRPPA